MGRFYGYGFGYAFCRTCRKWVCLLSDYVYYVDGKPFHTECRMPLRLKPRKWRYRKKHLELLKSSPVKIIQVSS